MVRNYRFVELTWCVPAGYSREMSGFFIWADACLPQRRRKGLLSKKEKAALAQPEVKKAKAAAVKAARLAKLKPNEAKSVSELLVEGRTAVGRHGKIMAPEEAYAEMDTPDPNMVLAAQVAAAKKKSAKKGNIAKGNTPVGAVKKDVGNGKKKGGVAAAVAAWEAKIAQEAAEAKKIAESADSKTAKKGEEGEEDGEEDFDSNESEYGSSEEKDEGEIVLNDMDLSAGDSSESDDSSDDEDNEDDDEEEEDGGDDSSDDGDDVVMSKGGKKTGLKDMVLDEGASSSEESSDLGSDDDDSDDDSDGDDEDVWGTNTKQKDNPVMAALRAKLHARVNELRAARKADTGTQNPKKIAKKEAKAKAKAHREARKAKRAKDLEERQKRNKKAKAAGMGSNLQLDFGAFDYADGGAQALAKGGGPRKDSKRALLRKLEKEQERAQKLKGTAAGAAEAQKKAWSSAEARASGVKVLDDAKLLRKSLKREEKAKARSARDWDARKGDQKKEQAARQEKRTANLQARIDSKKNKKAGIKIKKPIVKKKGGAPSPSGKAPRPGFEGKKRGFLNKRGGKR